MTTRAALLQKIKAKTKPHRKKCDYPVPIIQTVSVDKLVPAPWNFKEDGSPEEIQKLAESIRKDQSAGVLAARELPNGMLEVFDGIHRLPAIQMLRWKDVKVENFGAISKAEAIIISRRRNHQWFEVNQKQYATLMRDEVLPEYPLEDLSVFLPDVDGLVEALSELTRDVGGMEEDPDYEYAFPEPSSKRTSKDIEDEEDDEEEIIPPPDDDPVDIGFSQDFINLWKTYLDYVREKTKRRKLTDADALSALLMDAGAMEAVSERTVG
jgi:hypothetical protein